MSCGATSASSATSSSTSSRTRTSPRSSSSSSSAGRPIDPTTSWSSATTTSRSTASAAPASPPSSSSTAGSRAPPTHDRDGRRAGHAAAPPDRGELPLVRARPRRRQPPDRSQPHPLRARQAARTPPAAPGHRSSSSVRQTSRTRRPRSSIAIKPDGLGRPTDERADSRPGRTFAVLYRKHKHREAIVARLRDEGIPYTVVGGLSLFETPRSATSSRACARSPTPPRTSPSSG